MPAIFGCIDLSGAAIPSGIRDEMQKPFNNFKIDKITAEHYGSAVIGCVEQYIRSWSKDEQLPYIDKENSNIFTADCLIDNRQELIAQLCPGNNDIPDGALLYLAYREWGPDMARRVYGCYSYALYNTRDNTLTLGVDHTASRTLYYRRSGNLVYFSTRMDSILNACGDIELNEEWLMLFLGLKYLSIHTNPIDTPYKGISRVEAAHYNLFTAGDMRPCRYWSHDDIKPLVLKSDDEYKERFLEIFKKSVQEQIQGTDGEVGVLLSGGFDSTTIAAIAAQKLETEGKKLYGYSHIPIEGHKKRYKEKN